MSISNDLRWDDLRIFLLLCRTGTLTATAQVLGIHTSTAQRRLTELERALDTTLFERAPSGLTPTAAGEAMRPLAQQVEDDVDALLRGLVGLDSRPQGVVHLTAPEPLLSLLVEPLSAFRAQHPAIDLRVSFADRFFDLSRREADVAVRPSPAPPADAVGRRLGAVAWAVYASPRMMGGADPVTLPWAIYGDSMVRLAASAWWKVQHGGDPVLLTVNSVSAMHRVTACSPCRGLLPCFVGDLDPSLTRLGPPISAPESGLWLLVHPDLRRTARVRVLVDHLWTALRPHRALIGGSRHPAPEPAPTHQRETAMSATAPDGGSVAPALGAPRAR